MKADDRPQSVEEAGALLGATITRCGSGSHTTTAAPKGMHSTFGTVYNDPSSELLERLHYLRSFLRSLPQNTPLAAAPSLLAVLMKLLGVSRELWPAALAVPQGPHVPQGDNAMRRIEIPPMLSTPLRKLWVDCIVICHRLGEDLTGSAKTSLFAFVRDMLALAGSHPRTGKAAGGTRIAALEVIGGLFSDSKLSAKLAPWAQDAFHLCMKALKSSGNGEPTYRISAVKTACSVADGCRQSSLEMRPQQGKNRLYLKGALEDKAIIESVKLLKQAATDKFPEVRSTAATFAAMLAPMLLLSHVKKSSSSDSGSSAPTASLEEVMQLALKNIDDERAEVAAGWAEALSRCMSTAIEYGERTRADAEAGMSMSRRGDEKDDRSGDGVDMPRKSGKKIGIAAASATLKGAIGFLVHHFIKVGGERAASRAGGTFSMGGRAVRVGISVALEKLLRFHLTLGYIGEEEGVSMREILLLVLNMVGDQTEKQLKIDEGGEFFNATSLTPSESNTAWRASAGEKKSHADAGLVRLAASRVLRQGISEFSSEAVQLSILRELIKLSDSEQTTTEEGTQSLSCNRHQMQVILIEISHLLTALGEATGASVEDLSRIVRKCLEHKDHGVRHEAAVTCAALSSIFPEEGRRLLHTSVQDIPIHLAQLAKFAATSDNNNKPSSSDPQRSLRRMFARKVQEEPVEQNMSLPHQYATHGIAFMMSVVVSELPRLPGGLPMEILGSVLSSAQELVGCLFNDVMTKSSPTVACSCVRAGFGVICGVLTAGPEAVAPHIVSIFDIWQKTYKNVSSDKTSFTPDHHLICLDAMLSSVVAFLNYCSELLLSVPQALSQTSMMLEEILPLFLPDGRLGSSQSNPIADSRQQSAKASLLEAFAWLPSGSFPMAADLVFDLAARQIRASIEADVACSILPTLVNKEDMVLDAKSFCRAERVGQVGGARDIEESIITRKSEVVHYGERESVFHLLGHLHRDPLDEDIDFHGSHILGMFAFDGFEIQPPTPLHEVGTWRKPVDPSGSSKVRLVDAAIQAFSATFGMKDGKEQQAAMEMLESLIPPLMAQLARTIGLSTALTEQERRIKTKEDTTAVANITAVLLSCLQALPLHEATQSIPTGLGPPWMNKAKDLLLTVLPSGSNIVRRASCEGLALLSTLGAKSEDAHFLQSTVLHSLDEVMHGNQPDGKPRPMPVEPFSAARAGAMLTLACIQRTAQELSRKQMKRSLCRTPSTTSKGSQSENDLPTIQMMTRVLPSAACQGFRDFFVVRTHALHAYGLLLAYNPRFHGDSLHQDDAQLLRKAIELVESNFVEAWTAASADFDRGQEGEKLATEPALLSVLLRLMTFLVPSLHHVQVENEGVASRFSLMATMILEYLGTHPVIAMEGMAFFETLASHQNLLPPPLSTLVYTEKPRFSCIPFILNSVTPARPEVLLEEWWKGNKGCFASPRGLRAIIRNIKLLSLSQIFIVEWSDMKVVALLYSLLEATCAARCFAGSTLHRSLAAPRSAELAAVESIAVEKEVCNVLRTLLALESTITDNNSDMMLRWILLARQVLVNATGKVSSDEDETLGYSRHGVIQNAEAQAANDASFVFGSVSSVRWQVKSLAAQIVAAAIEEMIHCCRQSGLNIDDSPEFSHKAATVSCLQDCQEASAASSKIPPSRLVFHLEGIVSAAGTSSVAAIDHAELQTLQSSGLLLLTKIIEFFGRIPDPDQPGALIMHQYATQIISSIKHALEMPEATDGGDASFRRFWAGCVALEMAVETGLTKDKMALTRILRPAVPTSDEVPFFQMEDGCPREVLARGTSMEGNRRATLVPRIAKVWTVSKLLSRAPYISSEAASALSELIGDEPQIAANSAAIALDGARLLLASGTSLCGFTIDAETTAQKNALLDYPLLFQNVNDLDEFVKSAMVKAWSACACYALVTFVKALGSEEKLEESKRAAYSVWIQHLVPLLFSGLQDSLSALRNPPILIAGGAPWLQGTDASIVAADCLRGLSSFIENIPDFENRWLNDFENAVQMILSSVFLPVLGCVDSSDSSEVKCNGNAETGQSIGSDGSGIQTSVIEESCKFLKKLALSKRIVASHDRTGVLLAVLTPLDLLQRKAIQLERAETETIISACLESASSLVSNSEGTDTLAKAMLQVAVGVLSTEKGMPDRVTESARCLLRECLLDDTINAAARRKVAYELASNGRWESWSVVCALDDGMSATESFKVLQALLVDANISEQKSEALATIRMLIQNPQVSNQLLGRILNGIGAEILGAFQTFGTSTGGEEASKYIEAKNRRSAACADCMKIILICFQQLLSNSTEDREISAFLFVVFERLIAILRYNGLPNHRAAQVGSDEALGRMCAQAILHICRTSPAPFKSTMVSMSEGDRAIVEFAVRAEMSGYATAASQAPVKKKLNLSSFKKK